MGFDEKNISRRKFIKGAGALTALPILTGLSKKAQADPGENTARPFCFGTDGTQLVLLGTSGGVSWWPRSNRTSSSSAIVVGDTIYLIDLGQNSTYRLSQAFNSGSFVNSNTIEDPDGLKFPFGRVEDGSSTFLKNLKALFFTHLHPDHISDFPAFLLIGSGNGLGNPQRNAQTGALTYTPLQVFGPCDRGQLETDKVGYTTLGGTIITTDLAAADSIAFPGIATPTPGTRHMTKILWQALAQSINDMTLDNGYPDFTKLITITEIGGTEPGDIQMTFPAGDPYATTCPPTAPFQVYPADGTDSDENGVSVMATLVDHRQVFPAFAYRFNTPDGSVVFSGDTGHNTTGKSDPTRDELASGNLQNLANGADILVHEVIDRAWIDQKFGSDPQGNLAALKTHMLNSHTAIDQVGSVAEDCNVKTLVLNHIIPGNTPLSHLRQARQNFSGKLIIGEDLMRIGISNGRSRILLGGE